jgi:release factor glutamine methyltransferase
VGSAGSDLRYRSSKTRRPDRSNLQKRGIFIGMEAPWTILKLIQWTTQYFSGKGIAQPRTDAEVLLAYVLKTERIQLYLHYDQPLQSRELTEYREAVRRRGAHEPVQYITGRQEFWSLEMEVTPAVLIPRPETEILVEKTLALLNQQGSASPQVLDVGTGSGAIAVALAHESPALRVVASDVSVAALEVARRNAERHRVADRIRLAAMDLLTGLSPARAVFDAIVSNPPYVASSELPGLAPEISECEPEGALNGGVDGLAVVHRLMDQACPLLRPSGFLLIEIGMGQTALLKEQLVGETRYDVVEFVDDYAGIPRVMHLRRASGE